MVDSVIAFAVGLTFSLLGVGVAVLQVKAAKIEMCREMGGEWVGEVNAQGAEVWSCKPAEGAK